MAPTPPTHPPHLLTHVHCRPGFCWGSNEWGQLGMGVDWVDSYGQPPPSTPQPIAGGHVWSAIDAGTYHACAIDAADSTAWCWGRNSSSELGTGWRAGLAGQSSFASGDPATTPAAVAGGLKWSAIGAGNGFSCALKADDSTAW